MLNDKYDDLSYDNEDDNWFKPTKKRALKSLKKLKKEDDPYIPIFFTSCNYDTYIIPLTNNYVLIETCNNTYWNIKDTDNVVHVIPDEVMEKYPNSNGGWGEINIRTDKKNNYGGYIDVIYNHSFFLIENGIELTKPSDYKTCNTCYNDIWVFGNKEICINCDLDFIMRSKKIKKILNGIT
jgi:hypothetical protein